MHFPTFTLFAVAASAPASALSTEYTGTTASLDLMTMDFAASWNSANRSPNESSAQMCAT